jgi:hypothetical protein
MIMRNGQLRRDGGKSMQSKPVPHTRLTASVDERMRKEGKPGLTTEEADALDRSVRELGKDLKDPTSRFARNLKLGLVWSATISSLARQNKMDDAKKILAMGPLNYARLQGVDLSGRTKEDDADLLRTCFDTFKQAASDAAQKAKGE